MTSCLGISVENNLIKYAKMSKGRDSFDINTFGVKTYDKLGETLEQIIEETQSRNIPICMNLSEEMYNYLEVFSLLNKKDIKSVLSSEFELLCEEKGYNFQILDSRYILTQDYIDREKTKAIYISVSRSELATKLQKLQKYKINTLASLPISMINLIGDRKTNTVVVNIEDKTTMTTIINGEIVTVDIIEAGMKDILNKINLKENSYSKAYEICKNTTIYTMDTKDSQIVENDYLEDIMPTLYEIVSSVKTNLDSQMLSIQKIYITGTASVIGNIELYFQEYFTNMQCEILVPHFIDKKSSKVNIKDYIEVNSACALALQGLGEGYKEANFKNTYISGGSFDSLKTALSSDVSLDQILNGAKKLFAFDFKSEFGLFEKGLLRLAMGLLLIVVLYSGGIIALTDAINTKTNEVQEVINDTNEKIATITDNTTKVQSKTSIYTNRITNLEEYGSKRSTEYYKRKAIPTLLNEIMSVIPKNVQLTSIENPSEDNIIIYAQSEQYQDLGYFKAVLKTNGILLNVNANGGVKTDSIVKITIEGKLPWEKY